MYIWLRKTNFFVQNESDNNNNKNCYCNIGILRSILPDFLTWSVQAGCLCK